MKVYIVEDDWGVRDALVELVSGLGYSVEAYGEAESFIKAGLPGSGDLVLVDLALPGVRGEELLQQLRRLASPPRMVAISGQPKAEIESAVPKFAAVRGRSRRPFFPVNTKRLASVYVCSRSLQSGLTGGEPGGEANVKAAS